MSQRSFSRHYYKKYFRHKTYLRKLVKHQPSSDARFKVITLKEFIILCDLQTVYIAVISFSLNQFSHYMATFETWRIKATFTIWTRRKSRYSQRALKDQRGAAGARRFAAEGKTGDWWSWTSVVLERWGGARAGRLYYSRRHRDPPTIRPESISRVYPLRYSSTSREEQATSLGVCCCFWSCWTVCATATALRELNTLTVAHDVLFEIYKVFLLQKCRAIIYIKKKRGTYNAEDFIYLLYYI